VDEKKVKPVLLKTYTWQEMPKAHQIMAENRHPYGNTAFLVGASRPGEGRRH
jgi:hypothetical protein